MTSSGNPYRERVLPGAGAWLGSLGFVGLLAIAYGAAFDAAAGWLLAIGGTGLVVLAQLVRSMRIVVDADGLTVGDARLPASAIGATAAVDAAGISAALGPGADARTYTALLRARSRGGVVVTLADPDDPHPAWIVSSNRPEALATALASITAGPRL